MYVLVFIFIRNEYTTCRLQCAYIYLELLCALGRKQFVARMHVKPKTTPSYMSHTCARIRACAQIHGKRPELATRDPASHRMRARARLCACVRARTRAHLCACARATSNPNGRGSSKPSKPASEETCLKQSHQTIILGLATVPSRPHSSAARSPTNSFVRCWVVCATTGPPPLGTVCTSPILWCVVSGGVGVCSNLYYLPRIC